MRIALAVLLALHGVAHGAGFAGAWGLLRDAPRTTTVMAGRVELGNAGARAYGLLWLAVGVAFLLAAFGAITDRGWWIALTVVITLVSLPMSVLTWPESRIGVAVNLAILAVLAW